MKKTINDIRFYDDCAYSENEPYEKKDIIGAIKSLKEESTDKIRITKSETGKKIQYIFNFDNETMNIIIPKKYSEENKQYIELLDKWYSENRKQLIRSLKKASIITALAAAGLVAFHKPIKDGAEKAADFISDLMTDEVGNLEDEIEIHSGHGHTPDGSSISPFLEHSCKLGDDKIISVQDRIRRYCEENELEYLEERAIQKYEYLLKDDIESANEIELKKLEKEYKKSLKK